MNNHVTILEIDANAVLHNLQYFKQKLQPETKILAVVKAFGYGSDGVQVAKFLEDKVDYFAVAYTHEGIALREAGVKTPILVLHPQITNLPSLVKYRLEPNLYNFKIFKAFLELADKAPLILNPLLIASLIPCPALRFSLILSKIITLASTDIPMVKMIPAIPGNVNTAPKEAKIPKMNKMLTAKAISAYKPAFP